MESHDAGGTSSICEGLPGFNLQGHLVGHMTAQPLWWGTHQHYLCVKHGLCGGACDSTASVL
eukprot:1124338-Pelagomonas_calceolata.AAC.19